MSKVIGELRARLVAEAGQMKQEIRSVKQEIKGLGDEGQKTAEKLKRIDMLGASLDNVNARIELQKKKLFELQKSYDSAFSESRKNQLHEQILKADASLQKLIQTSDKTAKEIADLEDSLRDAGNEMDDLEGKSKGAERGIRGIASGLAALGAGAALNKLTSTITTLADEAHQLSMSYGGLGEVAKAFNRDVEGAADLADRLADRWGLNRAAVADTVKTYLSLNLSLEDTEKMITATADAAVYNREAHLTWEGAIKQVAQGIKAGNSNLTDAAGITTNLSVMQERYARTIGKTAATLTEAEKVQAAYNGMMQEASIFAGNADKAMEGYTGTQATFNATIVEARAELGEAFIPILQELMEEITPVIRSFALWSSENKETVAGVAAASVAITGLIAVVGALAGAFLVLNAAMGPVGWAILGIGALATGTVAYTAAANAAADSVSAFASSQGELNQKLRESPLNRTVEEVKNLQSDIENISDLVEKHRELIEEIERTKVAAEEFQRAAKEKGYTVDDFTAGHRVGLTKLQKQLSEVNGQLKAFGIDTPERAPEVLERMKKALDESVPALHEMKRAEIAAIATKVEHIDQIDQLYNRYQQLAAAQSLDEAQKEELKRIVKQLKEEYPDLNALLDEEGRMYIANEELIRAQIEAEQEAVDVKANLYRTDLENLVKTAEKKAEILKAEIDLYEQLKQKQAESTSGSTGIIDGLPELPLAGMSMNVLGQQIDKSMGGKYESYNKYQETIRSIKQDIQSLDADEWDKFRPKPVDFGDEAAKKGKDPEQEAFNEAIKLIRYKTEMYDWSAEQQIEAFERVQREHQKYLGRAVDDERMVQVQIKQLKDAASKDALEQAEKTRKAEFDFSVKWIEREKYYKRLSLEEELAAWERVQARYLKGTEEREKAEREIFRVKQEIVKQDVQRATELEKSLSDLQKETERYLSDQQKALDTARKAELKAIDEAKKAYVAAQDEKIKAIERLIAAERESYEDDDYAAELAKKQARADLLSAAVGPEGQRERRQLLEEIARMEEERRRSLRERELEGQKQALQDERTAQEQAFDEQKRTVDLQYDTLLAAFEGYKDDVETLEQAIMDFRVEKGQEANAQVLADLDTFIVQYRTKMVEASNLSSQLSRQQDWNQYVQNQAVWNDPYSSQEQRRAANAQNIALRDKYGISQSDYLGIQHFSTGGIVKGAMFGQTIPIMAEVGEMILNPAQQAALFRILDNVLPNVAAGATSNTNHVTNNIDLSVGEVHQYDRADVQSLYEERELVARRVGMRDGVKTG